MEMWKNLNFDSLGTYIDQVDGRSFGLIPLMKDVLQKDKGCVFEYSKDSYINADPETDESAEHRKFFENLGGRLIYKNGGETIFLWKDGMVNFSMTGSYVVLRVMSHQEDLVQKVQDRFEPLWKVAEKKGHVYAIVQQGSHLSLSSIGNAGISLVAENYTPKVVEDYKYIISDLQSEYPSGRIVVMRGTPGTGKTHLIRAMLLEVPDAMFVLISPEMVTSLAGPQLLPLLMSYRGGTTGPIVLLLEDADKCLVARDKDNINSIQSLLNLGDGILGSLLDLRIVATTNANELHMEEAIMRPGRLSKMLEVGKLDVETARGVFRRLCPKKKKLPTVLEDPDFTMTLAEVYSLARKNGWKPGNRKVELSPDDDDMFD
jgi:hypothetical protein